MKQWLVTQFLTKKYLNLCFSLLIPGLATSSVAGKMVSFHFDIVVDAGGGGDFKTVTEAIDALPMYTYERVVIFIRDGVYNEKIRIEQDNITLRGESTAGTMIRYAQLRSDWEENKDFIGPAVINIHADDIILKDLTILNTQEEVGPHAFTIYGTGTRTILDNCVVRSKGGDTVSLWNYKSGMYYHSNCTFEGAVDFVCPRGWCYITGSSFFEVQKTAAIWHAAVLDRDQKFVIRDSHFDGVEGFQLGRHHYEAQFYLLDCTFSETMADTPIYHAINRKAPEKNRPYFWGDRYYYQNCTREGGDYSWHTDNLARTGLQEGDITAAWTFDGKWAPESSKAIEVRKWKLDGNDLYLYIDERATIRGAPELHTTTGKTLTFAEGRGRDILRFDGSEEITREDITGPLVRSGGEIVATQAFVEAPRMPSTIELPQQH